MAIRNLDPDEVKERQRQTEAHITAREERIVFLDRQLADGRRFYAEWPAKEQALERERAENEQRLQSLLRQRGQLGVQAIAVERQKELQRLKARVRELEREVMVETTTGRPPVEPTPATKHVAPLLDHFGPDVGAGAVSGPGARSRDKRKPKAK